MSAFHQELQAQGWLEGGDVQINLRLSARHFGRAGAYA
jgi:hypothetical protein